MPVRFTDENPVLETEPSCTYMYIYIYIHIHIYICTDSRDHAATRKSPASPLFVITRRISNGRVEEPRMADHLERIRERERERERERKGQRERRTRE